MSEWQPIETAPKDGTPVDLWVRRDATAEGRRRTPNMPAGERVTDARWAEDRWRVYDAAAGYGDGGDVDVENDGWWGTEKATHWMPPPPPPK